VAIFGNNQSLGDPISHPFRHRFDHGRDGFAEAQNKYSLAASFLHIGKEGISTSERRSKRINGLKGGLEKVSQNNLGIIEYHNLLKKP
jgi:hypothetical protein